MMTAKRLLSGEHQRDSRTTLETRSKVVFRGPGQRHLMLISSIAAASVFFGIATPHFASVQTAINIASAAAVLLVVSIGATLVITAGEIDLTPGAIVGLVSVAIPAMNDNHLPMPVFLLGALLIGGFIGAVNALATLRLLVPSFLTTLGIMAIVRGAAVSVSTQPRQVRDPLFMKVFTGDIGGVPLLVIYALIVVVVAIWFLSNSRFGLRVRAVGSSEASARLLSLPTARTKTLVFIVAGALSALGGVFLLGRTLVGVSAESGVGLELNAIAAVLLGGGRLGGGRSSALGTALGALLLTVTLYGIAGMGIPAGWQYFTQGAILVLVVLAMRK